ncbi:MAG: HEAT repeat domain-containing protein [Armatimonadota bacterium]
MPGISGNPNGRPSIPKDLREAAKEYTWETLDTIRSIMEDVTSPPNVRLRAAEVLLDRGWGKVAEYVHQEEKEDDDKRFLVVLDR